MSYIHIPTTGPSDWKRFLAAPERQWKSGYSAKELAQRWETANGFPDEINSILKAEQLFTHVEPLFAIPEFQVPLPGGSRPSQNDLFVLARTDNGLVVIMVEGKASESFGPTLGEWRQQSSNGRQTRLAYLQQTLGLNRDLPDSLRYQLLHRTASPIIIARRYHAVAAVMLVHSFSKTNEWFSDYATFLNLYGIKTDIGELHEIMVGSPLRVFCGWAKGIPAI